MKLPISKIKKLLRSRGYSFNLLEVSFWDPADDAKDPTCNMLNVPEDADLADVGVLSRKDVDSVEDDGNGLAKLDLRMGMKDRYDNVDNVGYVNLYIFDGEPYLELPPPLDTELGRAVYLANKTKGAKK